jgi:hypothetical protein
MKHTLKYIWYADQLCLVRFNEQWFEFAACAAPQLTRSAFLSGLSRGVDK